jgi:hypothetical protein
MIEQYYSVEHGRLLHGGEPLPLELMESLCRYLNARAATKAVMLEAIARWRETTVTQIQMLEVLKKVPVISPMVENHLLFIELTKMMINGLERTL